MLIVRHISLVFASVLVFPLAGCLEEDELDELDYRGGEGSNENACNNGNGNKNGLDCDGDGYKKKDDCDDDDPDVHPGALDDECNGIDNNCNGEIDEEYVDTDTACGDKTCPAQGELLCIDGKEVDTCEPVECVSCDLACKHATQKFHDKCLADGGDKEVCAAKTKKFNQQCHAECDCQDECVKKLYEQCIYSKEKKASCDKLIPEFEKKCAEKCDDEEKEEEKYKK
jgi:hypothetical protein